MLVDDHLRNPGLRSVGIREVQKSLKESAMRLIADKILALGVGDHFEILADQIKAPGDGLIIFQGMQDHTAETIKSLEGFGRAWCEEAQTLTHRSLQLLRPTIRQDASELWFSWNPCRELDPVDELLRKKTPSNAAVVQANWRDNPWFPAVLEQERLDCLRDDPDDYNHIWEGEYVTVVRGAYYAQHLAAARREKRIGRVPREPLHIVRLYCDIGGTGARSDAFAIWAIQFIRHTIRVLDYYEAVGQDVVEHLDWLRERKYTTKNATIILPHDGVTQDRVFSSSYEGAFRSAGYAVRSQKNLGAGAAKARIVALRKIFSKIWFNEATTRPGLQALGWYHEKWDEQRAVGLGPEHDWSSHAADALGLMATDYAEPTSTRGKTQLEPEVTPAY